ncbi:MAG: nitroreductase A [Methanoregulaceae archaeon PtaB.Bin056]|nr:MAG: nitroreductase A [Methanoregulaceae archaeon PtaB.Bin056]
MDSSEFLEFLVSRCSVRRYDQRQVPDADLTYILDCASTAPSAGNLEAWDVVMVEGEEAQERMAEAAFGQEHVATASLLLVVCANYVRSMSRYGDRGVLFAIQDATIACTYMMLAAHARRLHSCWVGSFQEEEVRQLLDLPSHVRPVAILCVGVGVPPGSYTERMPVVEHVHHQSW